LSGFLRISGVVCLVAFGCQRDGDAVRDAVRARQAEWRRDVAALGREQAGLRSLLDAASTSPGGSDLAGARRRLAAELDSNRQSLADLEIAVGQVGPRIGEAAGRGADEGTRALEDESARMAASLALLREQIPTLQKEVAALAGLRGAAEGAATNNAATADRRGGE